MSTRTLLSALVALTLALLSRAQEATLPAAAAPSPAAPEQPAKTETATEAPQPAAAEAPKAEAAPATEAPKTETAPAAEAPKTEAAPAAEAHPATAAGRDKDTLSVDFPDEDIKTILRNVADLFELNLVVPDTLTGKTSIKLRDVTWRQIFKVVLTPVGYSYVEEGNIIKIVSNESLQQEPVATEVFILNNAKAADIKPTIDGLVDAAGGGKILIDARSNALVVTERPSRMARVRSIIEQLDKATDQVMIESKFVEVTDRDIRNIGVNWAGLDRFTLGAGNMRKSYTNNHTSGGTGNATNTQTSNRATTNNGDGSTTSVTQINTGNQLLPVTDANGVTKYEVVNVASNGTTQTITGPTSQTTNTTTNPITSTATNLFNSTIGNVTTAVFSASDFSVILSALKSLNSVKVVSNPTVVTLNNTEATLNIGEEFPVPSYTYNAVRGAFEVSGFIYKPIGVILKVTPQVNARGVIKMSLEPEVSQRNGETSFGGAGGASIPIVATRKVKTQVSLQSGYTAGIGGLISTQRNHTDTKVPFFGDIPGIGNLFKHKAVQDTTANLLVFVTARTVTAEGALPEEVFDPRAIQGAQITRDELPGYRAAKGSDVYYTPAPAAPAEARK